MISTNSPKRGWHRSAHRARSSCRSSRRSSTKRGRECREGKERSSFAARTSWRVTEESGATTETVRDGWLRTAIWDTSPKTSSSYVLGRFKGCWIASDGEKQSGGGCGGHRGQITHIDQILIHGTTNRPSPGRSSCSNRDALRRETGRARHCRRSSAAYAAELLRCGDRPLPGRRQLRWRVPERWLPADWRSSWSRSRSRNGLVNSTMKVVRERSRGALPRSVRVPLYARRPQVAECGKPRGAEKSMG